MTDREAMQMALVALNLPSMKTQQMLQQRDEAITALRAALEQPEQDPVAYFDFQQLKFTWAKHMKIGPVPVSIKVEPLKLYTTPPQRKPFDILAITTAYEQGVGKGHQAQGRSVEIENPYAPGECQQAWALGYDEGKEQAASKAAHGIKGEA